MTTPVVAPRSGLNPPRAPAPTPPDTGAIPKEKTKTNPPRAISPEVARRRMTTPVVAPRSGLNPPRAAAPAAACVAGRSRGQHMLPQQPSKQTATAPHLSVSFPSSAWECVPRSSASHSRSRNNPQNKRQQRPTSKQTATAPHLSVSFPSSAWECVPRSSASHSRSRNRPQNKRQHPPIVIPESPPPGGLAFPPELQGILSHPLPQSKARPRNRPQIQGLRAGRGISSQSQPALRTTHHTSPRRKTDSTPDGQSPHCTARHAAANPGTAIPPQSS